MLSTLPPLPRMKLIPWIFKIIGVAFLKTASVQASIPPKRPVVCVSERWGSSSTASLLWADTFRWSLKTLKRWWIGQGVRKPRLPVCIFYRLVFIPYVYWVLTQHLVGGNPLEAISVLQVKVWREKCHCLWLPRECVAKPKLCLSSSFSAVDLNSSQI